MNAFSIVADFEKRVAEYAGAKYGVAVDCCTSGLFLSMKYRQSNGALLVAAALYLLTIFGIAPGGGEAVALSGPRLAVGLAFNFVLGALMELGVGLYGPCLDPGQPAGDEPAGGVPDHDGRAPS